METKGLHLLQSHMETKGLLLLLTDNARASVAELTELGWFFSGTTRKHEGIFNPTDIPKGKKEFLGYEKMSVHMAITEVFSWALMRPLALNAGQYTIL